MLKPVAPQTLSQQVYAQLQHKILHAELHPGDRLPPERELSEQLGVNRSSIREALKRLEQARLVRIRQGEGCVVLDFRTHAGFDLLRSLIVPGGTLDPVAVRSIFELRSLIGPEVARLAALRIDDATLELLAAHVHQLEACPSSDVARFQELDFEFHHIMARASENLALLLILNSAREVYLDHAPVFAAMFETPESERGRYRQILDALRDHDAERARQLCDDLMTYGNTKFLSALTGDFPA